MTTNDEATQSLPVAVLALGVSMVSTSCLGGGPMLPEPPILAGSSEGTAGEQTTGASATGVVGTTSGVSATGMADSETGVTPDSTGSSDSSSGEPPQEDCETNVDFCDTWFLRPGTQTWEARRMFYDSPDAPQGPALAAFDIDASNEGYVLTARSYHVLDLTAEEWVGSGPLDDLMPEVAMYGGLGGLVSAYSVDNVASDDDVYLTASDGHYWIYVYLPAGSTFDLGQQGTLMPLWEGPDSPAFADMKDQFLDLEDAEGWYAGGVLALCGSGRDFGFAPMVTTSGVSVQEIGNCFDYYPPQTYESFIPFDYADAPPHSVVGATLYNNAVGGLWVFRGT